MPHNNGMVGRDILVVDDDFDARCLLQMLVQGLGYRCRVAADGSEALALIRAECPALILLDAMMPGVDGSAVLQGLSDQGLLEEIRVVMVTGVDLDKHEAFLQQGACQVIAKGDVVGVLGPVVSEIMQSFSHKAG